MEASNYIEETEKALTQLFDGLAFYQDIMKSDPKPVLISSVSPDDEKAWQDQLENWLQENKDAIGISIERQREYFGYTFSQGTLAGSILQIACMGISVFSTNNEIPKTCEEFVKPGSKCVKFCCGRTVCNLPIGIIILAARNQYNHWDDPKPRQLTIKVFNKIANASDKYTDPAFDIDNASLQTYSHNILALLGWKDYQSYKTDIEALLV